MYNFENVFYVLEHNKYNTYWISPSRADTSLPTAGVRFDKYDAAHHYLYSSGLEEDYTVKRATLTIVVE